MYFCLYRHMRICVCICICIYTSIYLSIYLSIYPSTSGKVSMRLVSAGNLGRSSYGGCPDVHGSQTLEICIRKLMDACLLLDAWLRCKHVCRSLFTSTCVDLIVKENKQDKFSKPLPVPVPPSGRDYLVPHTDCST